MMILLNRTGIHSKQAEIVGLRVIGSSVIWWSSTGVYHAKQAEGFSRCTTLVAEEVHAVWAGTLAGCPVVIAASAARWMQAYLTVDHSLRLDLALPPDDAAARTKDVTIHCLLLC